MRAAVFREMSKPLVVETLPDPEPGAHELILRVKNCGICGSDLHMTEPSSIMPLALGSVMGHEFSGEVAAVGS
ncbi:MAG TPA: alcohol dehydrogenase catalytic domain-containing protein, partial [Rhizomicrobium sp.]